MFKVFVEYAIKPGERDSYLIYMRELRQREGRRLELLEGTDQPGLFVEIWHGISYEEYESLKQDRFQPTDTAGGKVLWDQWIEGGMRKLHMWHFTQVAG